MNVSDIPTVSQQDIVLTLKRWQDTHSENDNDVVLNFISELTGLSEDTLSEICNNI